MGSFWLWQGFAAEWRYNHRLNRLGSAVEGDHVISSAASGTGPDRARIHTNAARVDVDGFEQGAVTFHMRGNEGEPLVQEQTVFLPSSHAYAESVLQGFDTWADVSADKPVSFALSVGDAVAVAGGFRVTVRAEWQGSCSTRECRDDGDTTSQTITAYYGVIESAAPLRLSTESFATHAEWTKTERSERATRDLPERGVTALKSVRLTLSDEMHWLRCETRVDERGLTLGFDNWRRGMKWSRVESLFSFRQAGAATLQATTAQLDLRCGERESVEHEIHWRGWGRIASGDDASVRTTIP